MKWRAYRLLCLGVGCGNHLKQDGEMIRATTKYGDCRPADDRVYVECSDLDIPLPIERHKLGYLLVGGVYIGIKPLCDGDDLCGYRAKHLITVVQNRDFRKQGCESETVTKFKNFVLLCDSCMEIFKSMDTCIGHVDLSKWFNVDGKVKK